MSRSSAPAGRTCFIHIGTHKTGTTSIQAFLRDNEAEFLKQGVLVPRAGRGEDAAGHHNLTQELLGAPDYVPHRGGLRELCVELRESLAARAVLSSEDFSLASRSPEALANMRTAVVEAGFTPVIVAYLRPQAAFCVSIYAEIVKNGHCKPFDVYLDEVKRLGSFEWNGALGPLFRYDILLDRFARVFGDEALVVKRFRETLDKDALLREFAGLIAARPSIAFDTFTFPPMRFNRSYSFGRVLRALGSEADTIDMRFAPLDLRRLLAVSKTFWQPNRVVLRRYGTWIPPAEFLDVQLALPLRKSIRRTTSLVGARRELRNVAYERNLPDPAAPVHRAGVR